MNNERFNDEIISAIIDGEADEETVAAANADPSARARLEQMRSAVAHVATPVPEARPERRNASIAAALAAATPADEVSSLAAARHARATQPARSRSIPRWIAAAAAAVLLIVAIPLLSRFGGSDTADTATGVVDDVDSTSLGLDGSADDAADDVETADRASADAADSSDDAMEEPQLAAETTDEEVRDVQDDGADEEADSAGDAAAADDAQDDAAPTTEAPAEIDADRVVVSNLEILDDFIVLGTVSPQLTAERVIAEGVSADCVAPFEVDNTALFDLVILDEFGGSPRLLLVIFNEDGSTTALDAEDCAQLG